MEKTNGKLKIFTIGDRIVRLEKYEKSLIICLNENNLKKGFYKLDKDIEVIFVIFNERDLTEELESILINSEIKALIIPIVMIEDIPNKKILKTIKKNLNRKLKHYFLKENRNNRDLESIIEGIEIMLDDIIPLNFSLSEFEELIKNKGQIIFKVISTTEENRSLESVKDALKNNALTENIKNTLKLIIIFETAEPLLFEMHTVQKEIKNSLRVEIAELLFAFKENKEIGDEFKIRIYALDYENINYSRKVKIG